MKRAIGILAALAVVSTIAFLLDWQAVFGREQEAGDGHVGTPPVRPTETDRTAAPVRDSARESDAPRSPEAAASRRVPPPVKPDVARLTGRDRIQAVRDYRAAVAAWRAANGVEKRTTEYYARYWAARMLGDDWVRRAQLDAAQLAELEGLYDWTRGEMRVVGSQMDEVAAPIFAERMKAGRYEERALSAGYPPPMLGIVHRHGIYPSRSDPSKNVRRVVSIRPGESLAMDTLRAERMSIQSKARAQLRLLARRWK